MQQKSLLALAAATALVAGAAAFLSLTGPETGADAAAGQRVLPALQGHLGDVASVELWHGGNKITLRRLGAGEAAKWGVAEKNDFPADETRLRRTLLGLSELTLVEPKTAKPEFYSRLDLEDPTAKDSKSVLARLGDGKGGILAEIITGKRRPNRLGSGQDGIYVRRPSEKRSWLAQGTANLGEDASDWMERRVAAIGADRIRQAVFTHADGTTLTLTRAKPEEELKLDGAPADTKYAQNDSRADIGRMFDPFEIADARPAAGFTWPDSGVARAVWTSFDGLTLLAQTVDEGDTHWVRLSADGEGKAKEEADRLNARWSGWIYAVPAYKAGAIRTRRSDLLEPEPPKQESPKQDLAKPARKR